MTTTVTRKDKLVGARQVVGGGVDLALAAADRRASPTSRRLTAAFGATGVLVGIGQARGVRPLYVGALAGYAATTAKLLTDGETLAGRRSARPIDGTIAGVGSGRTVPANGPGSGGVEPVSEPVSGPDKLKAARAIVSGGLALAMATDRSAKATDRGLATVSGLVGILSGVGRLRGSERIGKVVAGSLVVALPVAIGVRVAERVRR